MQQAELLAGATWLSLSIAVFSFWRTLKEARAASRKASAAEAAVKNLETRLGTRSMAYLNSQFQQLQHLVTTKKYDTALIMLPTFRREIILQAQVITVSEHVINDLKMRISIISTHLEYANSGNDKFKSEKVKKAILGVADKITDFEVQLLKTKRGSNNDY